MSWSRTLERLPDEASALVAQLAPFLTRLVLAHAFLLSGIGKWRNFDSTVAFFDGLGIPMPMANAAFVATVELAGGVALVLGLGTRVMSALLASTMVVALATADRSALLDALRGERSLTGLIPFVYLMLLAWLVGRGAGALSFDHRVRPAPRPAMLRGR